MSELDKEELKTTRELNKNKYKNADIFYDRKYLQQPISLLTKENLELLEQHCQRQLRHEVGQILREHEIVLELLNRYKQLETDTKKKDKMIDELILLIAENYCSIKDIVREDICDNRCVGNNNWTCYKCIKQYFERKVEENVE